MNENLFKDFFAATLTFLKQHQWMYNYPNTHILCDKVLDKIPSEWHTHLNHLTNDELNNLPFGGIKETWPESLKSIVQEIQDLKYVVRNYVFRTLTELPPDVYVGSKKAHEIVRLTAVVTDLCSRLNVRCIVDVGAGLGHFSQLLHERYNYKVLAVEGDKKIYEAAVLKQEKRYLGTKPYVKYIQHFVTSKSSDVIETALQEAFPDSYRDGVCITGLHSCADLSVAMLEMFRQLAFVICIAIMPCCYHRMGVIREDDYSGDERFEYFPVSDTLRTIYDKLEGWTFLRQSFMRLACQKTKSVWKCATEDEHRKHAISCMFRAVIQEAAEEGGFIVHRLKRKTGITKASSTQENVQHLVENFPLAYKLLSKHGDSDEIVDYSRFQSALLAKWNANEANCNLIEALTAFQTAIQNVCENIILLDRVCYLREKGLKCALYKVTDDDISPRCHALIATKL